MTDANRLFAEISGYIEECHALMKRGQFVELKGLDARVEKLCAQVMALPDTERTHHADDLAVLGKRLDELARIMQAHKDAIADEMGHAAGSRKANIAYKTADARDDFGKKNDTH